MLNSLFRTKYTSDASDKVEVAKVLDKIDNALARVQEWRRIPNCK